MDLPESHYIENHCEGEINHLLSNKTQVECLTDNYVIEYDFCANWAEALGKVLTLGRKSGKTPKIVLICKDSEFSYLESASKAAPEIKAEILWIDE